MAAPAVTAELFNNAPAVADCIRRATVHLRPPPNLLPSEWTEANMRIPAGNAVPGPMRLDNAPYQREPMDMLVNPDCYRISLMWGAQVGKTMLALCVQAYCIEMRPRSQMMMQPTESDLKTWLETKFSPLTDANANLRNLIAKPRGRSGVNNQRMKSYPGGFLMFAYSGSPNTMRGRSAPLVVCDEVDGYEVTKEGHPVGLLWQRAATFGDDRFLIEISTPTIKDHSYIETSFEAGDQRRFHVPCPHCGEAQTLKWGQVKWHGRDTPGEEQFPETARYACEHCGTLWDDGERIVAIRQGKWIGAKPFKGHASYHINEMYSTFRRLKDIAQSYIDKMASDDEQTFVNVSLAETWDQKGEQADPTSLQARAYEFTAPVPAGGLYLTAGIDMQLDRLEVEVVAWGVGEESWSIDYHVIWGDPMTPDPWNDLDDYLAAMFQHESGEFLPISAACLDTGGTAGCTQAAYDYAKGKTGRRLFAIKGQGGWGLPVVASPQRRQSGKAARKVDLFMVGVDEAKQTVMRRLAIENHGPGYCHVPAEREEEWYHQITAEKLITRYVKGFPVREWFKPDRARNEALDCRVYAYAALKITAPSMKRLAERLKMPETTEEPVKIARIEPKKREKPPKTDQKPPEKQPENPPEEQKTDPVQTVKLRRKAQLSGPKRRNFATNW